MCANVGVTQKRVLLVSPRSKLVTYSQLCTVVTTDQGPL